MINKTKLASDYAKRYNGKLKKAAIARKLYEDYPDIFKNSEDARLQIRRVTQAAGDPNWNMNRMKEEHKVKWVTKLPKPEANDFSRVHVNEKRIGILSDIHFPYYDEQALNAAINYLIDFDPDCIILNGDIIDCYHLSNFEKDKRQRSFKYEIDMLAAFFVELRELFPTQRIIYKLGNHCERYEKHILQQIPDLVELELFNFENVIQAKKYNIDVVKNKRVIKIGKKLNVLHGHEIKGGLTAPVNPARGLFLRAKASTIAGHNHQTSEHVESDLNGNIIGCWSTGTLSELHPAYMPINKWNHGFCTVEVIDKDGNFKVNNLKIIKGEIL